ncbi:hypothetical protein AND_004539 [Anopheles darlingi]|uniref:Uncharacterized protein n=1 Tax=Anopheles darlingi TaxID=43151 RepID=W5JH89_ANODA|nr:hypothetical protein AND_004539 [Anopheles darlingi]
MDAFFRMRRSSHTSAFGNQEPLIVVEESENCEKAEETSTASSQRQSLDIESPENPYLLSPWRDARETRKHSLPTPPCTSGITASQVRRLSERGGEGSGPSPREQAFLATLYSTPAPQPGGRRHSVVTISRVPPTMFGRSRRESIAAVPAAGGQRPASYSRRESNSGPPPSTDHRGSIHNLQLDIMDDIVQARKARMKLWNTSNERVCEVQTLDEAGTGSSSPMRYTNRRYSDFVGTALPPIQSFRRASELPVSPSSGAIAASLTPIAIGEGGGSVGASAATAAGSSATSAKPKTGRMGIVCTNTDLISLLSSLASSATEINRCGEKDAPSPLTPLTAPFKSLLKTPTGATASVASPTGSSVTSGCDVTSTSGVAPQSQGLLQLPGAATTTGEKLRKNRSNSFDSSLYHSIKQLATGGAGGGALSPGNATDTERSSVEPGWFTKRHQPMARRKSSLKSPSATLTFANEALEKLRRETRSATARVTILDPPKQSEHHAGAGKPSVTSSSSSSSTSSSAKASSAAKESRSPLNKLKWDGRSAIVDARMIGHAIENFITGSSSSSSVGAGSGSAGSGSAPPTGTGTSLLSKKTLVGGGGGKDGGAGGRSASKKSSTSSWFGKATDDDDSNDTCDSSLCSTLKDLFVK